MQKLFPITYLFLVPVYRPPGQTFRTGDGILTSPIHQPLGVTYLAVVSRRSAVLIITGIPRVRSVIIAEVFIGAQDSAVGAAQIFPLK